MKKYTRSFVERKGTALTQTQTKTPTTMAESMKAELRRLPEL
jgi:hypothetical protein